MQNTQAHDQNQIANPAGSYNPEPNVAVLTSFFNPARYRSKLANYERFIAPFRQSGIRVFTVECLFGEATTELSEFSDVLTVTAQSVVWQKERLLNVLISNIPAEYSKIAWVDCDILFCNQDWLPELAAQLEYVPLVQPFATAVWLPPGTDRHVGNGNVIEGFGSRYARDSRCLLLGDFHRHGHTGFAWAARRKVLDSCHLYDACIAGGADHVMVHGMCGDPTSPCITRLLGDGSALYRHFGNWAKRAYETVGGAIGFVEGAVLHLWHGAIEDRRYLARNEQLQNLRFDPDRDMYVGRSGCWQLARPDIQEWSQTYFNLRKEDN